MSTMSTSTSTADNLEYYLKFPQPVATDNTDFVFVVNEQKVPIVVLFGWAGCHDKYLAKYSAIYEKKGLITLRYTAPVNCLFWRRFEMKAIGAKLVRLLYELQLDSHPIIMHVFSNGGAFLYQNFALALAKTPAPFRIHGIIFDSAPGKRRLLSVYRAISAIIGGGPFYNIPVSILLTMFLSIIWFIEILKNCELLGTKPYTAQANLMEYLKREQHLHPQHFIYSKSDTLIPYKDIEYFANYRKQLGVDVSMLCFDNSPHVKHYSAHEHVYVHSVYTFVQKCLA